MGEYQDLIKDNTQLLYDILARLASIEDHLGINQSSQIQAPRTNVKSCTRKPRVVKAELIKSMNLKGDTLQYARQILQEYNITSFVNSIDGYNLVDNVEPGCVYLHLDSDGYLPRNHDLDNAALLKYIASNEDKIKVVKYRYLEIGTLHD